MKKTLSIFAFIVVSQISVTTLSAFTIEKNSNVPVEKNFVVGPAKIEREVAVGETQVVRIVVDNKTGRTQTFSVGFEDFVAGQGDEAITLLGGADSKTSLKNFLSAEQSEFTLSHGDRAIIPISITIPIGTQGGGKFASVVISAVSNNDQLSDDSRVYSGAVVIGRVASLLFVTVPGDVSAEGSLQSITTKNDRKVFFDGEVPLRLLFENTGNVSLNPYGIVTIKNVFGRDVANVILDPWYTLPDSVRTRDVLAKVTGGFGFYTAVASVNRGYEDIVDESAVSFFVISPLAGLLVLGALIVLIVAIIRKLRNSAHI